MITLTLSDPNIRENTKAVMSLREMGVFSEDQIQSMYDDQIRKDAAEVEQHENNT